jgi:hypothetical protein
MTADRFEADGELTIGSMAAAESGAAGFAFEHSFDTNHLANDLANDLACIERAWRL